ncbi:beta-N-acetylhexosaminidase [Sulfurirhabdus autotrophica]|uniref:Beta-hexosaminidase n=1 Tax=Sulfurirhabdus autotrophica TaxID=1706046 RepID=A0A4R3YDW7_9PROT|nr:beta-N-acetylhexosaminidase [Sulfurirhabdus autotrophica]TCV90230.1 beta-N-acetylhexosaminidase [Sulfurirhabdus autotrophica]
MSLGPVMLDVLGTELTEEDRKRLLHPLTGGVILFSRNYESPAQLTKITQEIHSVRNPPLLIGVDQEGGRVQRCKAGFTRIPPMREFGRIWDEHPHKARQLAQQTGYVLAAELRACGVDFSFTPVLDMDYGQSGVIGDRAFHLNKQAIAELAHSLVLGLKEAGMASVGKHFPGHGYIKADSHLEIPIDDREFADIELNDLVPFKQMINFGLTGIMPAHVIYPKVDKRPAGFSKFWLKDILRNELRFDGTVFSDDLSMEGASVAGGIVDRAKAALEAGCDMVLVCNRPDSADELLANLHWNVPPVSLTRLVRMHGKPHPDSLVKLHEQEHYVNAVHAIAGIGFRSGDLPLKQREPDSCGDL